jgi:hypothetical protein
MLMTFMKRKPMRTAIVAAVTAICLGFVGSSTVSAAPIYGASISAAAATLDLRQDAYIYRPYRRYYGYRGYYGYRPYYGYRRYYGYGGYYRYGGYRPCFQTCPGRSG